jgi:hypothetical protein
LLETLVTRVIIVSRNVIIGVKKDFRRGLESLIFVAPHFKEVNMQSLRLLTFAYLPSNKIRRLELILLGK